ncbi:MAG: DNA-3-methyladenine glycosylase [Bacteroidales bacterium]|nr:DNA-3-methyladenine glycosylase [Bacteroidales bacterium]
MIRLQKSYFLGNDVESIARSLLGKYLFTKKEGQLAGGILTEVEAYKGIGDRASHAYGGRRTRRNEMMYQEGGVVYMFLCYGMHSMLNFVTNAEDVPDAILVRGLLPTHGEELMLQRTGKLRGGASLTDGPGKVCKALGLTVADNGVSLDGDTVWLEDRDLSVPDDKVEITPRIGVDYAGEDAKRLYRFYLNPRYVG